MRSQPGIVPEPVSARANDEGIALVTDGHEEIAAGTHGDGHQKSIWAKAQVCGEGGRILRRPFLVSLSGGARQCTIPKYRPKREDEPTSGWVLVGKSFYILGPHGQRFGLLEDCSLEQFKILVNDGGVPPTALEILRQQMREKFPQAHHVRPEAEAVGSKERSFQINEFPVGKISEVVPGGPAAGLILLVAGLLGDPSEANPHPDLVLIDGADAFDPSSFTGPACSKMLWVRCSTAMEMLRAADLLILDGNIPLVLLDATGLTRRELVTIPSSSWWRLNQTVERTGGRLVVMAPFAFVPCATLRLSLSAGLSLSDFDDSRAELFERLRATPERLRHVN